MNGSGGGIGATGYLPAKLRSFMARYPLDLELWLAQHAERSVGERLTAALPEGSACVALAGVSRSALQGPAVLLLTAADLRDQDQRKIGRAHV